MTVEEKQKIKKEYLEAKEIGKKELSAYISIAKEKYKTSRITLYNIANDVKQPKIYSIRSIAKKMQEFGFKTNEIINFINYLQI